jgi:hypothetical protein
MSPEDGNRHNPDEFGFEWADEELTPEVQELLQELSIPVSRPSRKMAEMVHNGLAQETQERLAELRVEGYNEVDGSWIRAIPEVQMTPNILDDVHYVIYEARKKQPLYSRFVSVSAREIFRELHDMKENKLNGAILQNNQTSEAFEFLATYLKMDEIGIYEAMRKGPEGSFAVRSLHRLLSEKSMSDFWKVMRETAERRIDEAPLTFDEVAIRAVRFINNKHSRISRWNTSDFSTDQETVHVLVLRDLARTEAFAKPLADFLGRHIEPELNS